MKYLLITLLSLSVLMSCSKSDDDNPTPSNTSIVGTWKAKDANTEVQTYKFTGAGRFYPTVKGGGGIAEDDKGNYKFSNGKLMTSFIDTYVNGEAVIAYDTVTCSVSGNTLTVSAYKYTRQ